MENSLETCHIGFMQNTDDSDLINKPKDYIHKTEYAIKAQKRIHKPKYSDIYFYSLNDTNNVLGKSCISKRVKYEQSNTDTLTKFTEKTIKEEHEYKSDSCSVSTLQSSCIGIVPFHQELEVKKRRNSIVPRRFQKSPMKAWTQEVLEELKKPLWEGWRREVVTRNDSQHRDTYYRPPGARKIRSMVELEKFLIETKSHFTRDNFSFRRETIGIGEPFEILRNARETNNFELSRRKKKPKSEIATPEELRQLSLAENSNETHIETVCENLSAKLPIEKKVAILPDIVRVDCLNNRKSPIKLFKINSSEAVSENDAKKVLNFNSLSDITLSDSTLSGSIRTTTFSDTTLPQADNNASFPSDKTLDRTIAKFTNACDNVNFPGNKVILDNNEGKKQTIFVKRSRGRPRKLLNNLGDGECVTIRECVAIKRNRGRPKKQDAKKMVADSTRRLKIARVSSRIRVPKELTLEDNHLSHFTDTGSAKTNIGKNKSKVFAEELQDVNKDMENACEMSWMCSLYEKDDSLPCPGTHSERVRVSNSNSVARICSSKHSTDILSSDSSSPPPIASNVSRSPLKPRIPVFQLILDHEEEMNTEEAVGDSTRTIDTFGQQTEPVEKSDSEAHLADASNSDSRDKGNEMNTEESIGDDIRTNDTFDQRTEPVEKCDRNSVETKLADTSNSQSCNVGSSEIANKPEIKLTKSKIRVRSMSELCNSSSENSTTIVSEEQNEMKLTNNPTKLICVNSNQPAMQAKNLPYFVVPSGLNINVRTISPGNKVANYRDTRTEGNTFSTPSRISTTNLPSTACLNQVQLASLNDFNKISYNNQLNPYKSHHNAQPELIRSDYESDIIEIYRSKGVSEIAEQLSALATQNITNRLSDLETRTLPRYHDKRDSWRANFNAKYNLNQFTNISCTPKLSVTSNSVESNNCTYRLIAPKDTRNQQNGEVVFEPTVRIVHNSKKLKPYNKTRYSECNRSLPFPSSDNSNHQMTVLPCADNGNLVPQQNVDPFSPTICDKNVRTPSFINSNITNLPLNHSNSLLSGNLNHSNSLLNGSLNQPIYVHKPLILINNETVVNNQYILPEKPTEVSSVEIAKTKIDWPVRNLLPKQFESCVPSFPTDKTIWPSHPPAASDTPVLKSVQSISTAEFINMEDDWR